MTARVFVPLVGANGEGQQLFEAIADAETPEPHPARLTPQISELFDFGLYGIGQTVREAVTRFIAKRREGLWLSRRNAQLAPWRLRISDLQVGRLSDENARSAGLGLAVAAICQAFGRAPDLVFATGEIVLPGAPGALTASIGAVGGVRGKLSLIGDYLAQHRQTIAGRRILVLLPLSAIDGRPLAEAEAATLARLKTEADGAEADLEFVFAETLDGLEAALGPFALKEIVTPRRAVALLAGFVGLAALASLFEAYWHAPIALAFEPPTEIPAASADASAPQRARYDSATDKLMLLEPCFDSQREPVVIGGQTLILRVSVRDGLPFASRLRPPRLFIASVSKAADPILLDAAHFRSAGSTPREQASTTLTAAIPIEPVEDEVRLFVVATRDPQVDTTSLQEALRKSLQGLSGAAVLTTTTSFLADRLGTEISYQFKVTNDPHACPA